MAATAAGAVTAAAPGTGQRAHPYQMTWPPLLLPCSELEKEKRAEEHLSPPPSSLLLQLHLLHSFPICFAESAEGVEASGRMSWSAPWMILSSFGRVKCYCELSVLSRALRVCA